MKEKNSNFLLIVYNTNKPVILIIIPLLIISFVVGVIYSDLNPILYLFPTSGEEYSLQIAEGIIFVSVTVLSAFLIVLAVRKKLIRILKIFFSLIFFISTTSIFWIHGYLLEFTFSMDTYWLEIILTIIGVLMGILSVYVIFFEKTNIRLKNALIFILGSAMGTIFGTVFNIVSFLSLLILISLFDIYSVFRGPIRQLLEKTNFSLSFNESSLIKSSMAIGIGDFVFYSSLVTFITRELGPILGFVTIVGVIVGIKITENLLIKYRKFPGLPIPIFFSLFLVLLGWILLKFMI